MSNRFHNKFHRHNHHTYNSVDADSGHDSIASPSDPFKGDFVINGALSANAALSAYAGLFRCNSVALCAIGGIGISTNSMYAANITGININGTNLSVGTIAAGNLNIPNWNSVYTSVNSTSANWNSTYNSVNPVSANWNSTYNSVNPVSANWNSVYNSVNPVSANWNSVYTSVNATSANWNLNSVGGALAQASYSVLTAASGNWNSVYSSVTSTSGNWNLAYTNVNLYSSNWNSVYSSVASTSGNWNGTTTIVNNNAPSWNSTYTTVYQYSGNWGFPRNRPYYTAHAASSINLFSPVQFASAAIVGMPQWAEYTDRGGIYYDGNYNSTYQTNGAANRHRGSNWFQMRIYVTDPSQYPIQAFLFRVDDQFYMYANGNYTTPIMKWTAAFSRGVTQAPITSSFSLTAGYNTIDIVTNNSAGANWGLDMSCPMLNPSYAIWVDPSPGY